MASVSFGGLASGLNTTQIIESLLSVDRGRIDALRAKKSSIANRISSVGTLKSRLATLQSKLESLRFASQVQARTAVSSGTGVSATATNAAAVGSFTVTVDQLATATSRFGASGVSVQSFDQNAALSSSGLQLTPTAGRFTVNGVAIDVPAPTKLQDFVDAINAAEPSTGVRAGYVLDGGGNPTGVRIFNSTNPVGTAISLGSGGDTSNFLTAVKLSTATQAGNEIASTATLGRAITSNSLATGRLATALSAASGSFTINGVSISWDGTADSINSVIGKINSSTANVTASYDAVSDRIALQSKVTGGQSISVTDTAGNLMAALRVTTAAGATETLGANALYRVSTIAGGAQQSSTSNTISEAVPGVSLTLSQQSATPVTVTVGQDVEKPLAAMREFVKAYNEAADFIRAALRPDATGRPGVLQGESAVRQISETMRSIAVSAVSGLAGSYSTLGDIGVSFGAVGSSVGSTNSMVLDEAKFSAALSSNPDSVHEVLNNSAAGSEGIFFQMRSFLNGATLPTGILSSLTDGGNSRQSVLDTAIKRAEERLEVRRTRLEAQFARMESAVAALQQQGARLQGQLQGLQG